jgi:hypothetical protein
MPVGGWHSVLTQPANTLEHWMALGSQSKQREFYLPDGPIEVPLEPRADGSPQAIADAHCA